MPCCGVVDHREAAEMTDGRGGSVDFVTENLSGFLAEMVAG